MKKYSIYEQEIDSLMSYCNGELEVYKKEWHNLYNKRCSGEFSITDFREYVKCSKKVRLLESLVNVLKYAFSIANELREVE